MVDFDDRADSRFEHVNLRGATFEDVLLNDATIHDVDLSEARLRAVMFNGARMSGVELVGVEIYGEIENVVVKGVDIAPLVDAELNHRMPERAKMRPEDPEGFQEAWAVLGRLWAATIERAKTFEEETLHRHVGEEWSFIQTLRHLSFASAAWVGRMILGNPSPWDPLDLPWDEAPGSDGIPWNRDARSSLDEVLALREQRRAMVGAALDTLTDVQLSSEVSCTAPGWPKLESFSLLKCLRIVLNEEWEHRLYAERDLGTLERER